MEGEASQGKETKGNSIEIRPREVGTKAVQVTEENPMEGNLTSSPQKGILW